MVLLVGLVDGWVLAHDANYTCNRCIECKLLIVSLLFGVCLECEFCDGLAGFVDVQCVMSAFD